MNLIDRFKLEIRISRFYNLSLELFSSNENDIFVENK